MLCVCPGVHVFTRWRGPVFQALADHKVQPLIRPFQGQVNAKDVYEIDRFDTHDTRRITVTQEDNDKYYKNFDHIMSHQWQEEVMRTSPAVHFPFSRSPPWGPVAGVDGPCLLRSAL